MYRNVASQKLAVYAWDGASGEAKTGDAANAPGVYISDLTQAETNGDLIKKEDGTDSENLG